MNHRRGFLAVALAALLPLVAVASEELGGIETRPGPSSAARHN
jgi:hypothetical protein